MALLYGRAGRLTAQNGDFGPGQDRSGVSCGAPGVRKSAVLTRAANPLTQGGQGGRPAPLHPPCSPLLSPQPDDSHPLLIATACDLVEVAHRRPPGLSESYHPRCSRAFGFAKKRAVRPCYLTRWPGQLQWEGGIQMGWLSHQATVQKNSNGLVLPYQATVHTSN
jgi:hypothetical protein